MPSNSPRKFYVGLHKKEGRQVGHLVTVGSPPFLQADVPESPPQPIKVILPDAALDFGSVLHAFVSVMDSYRKFIPLTLVLAPFLSSSIAERTIGAFVKAKGLERTDISTETMTIYEFDMSSYREFSLQNDEVVAALDGAKHLPEVMVIGLVSAYDAFLTRLLRVVLNKYEQIVLTSEKTIKFADLCKFGSIEDARASLIDREIETVMRSSHHEQITFIDKHFKLTLKNTTKILPQFIEICERRNLLTHTGGIVSAQYLSACKEQSYDIADITIGTRLNVDGEYYASAVNVINEMGVRMCYALWRKVVKHEHDKADIALNELCFDLIFRHVYSVAESLLLFGSETTKTHGKDRTRRTMLINLANAIRLQDRPSEAKEVLDKEDWSATSYSFQLCAAAVQGDVDAVVQYMRKIGASGEIDAEGYRIWPVFRSIKSDERFISAFEAIFAVPFIALRSVQISPPPEMNAECKDASQTLL